MTQLRRTAATAAAFDLECELLTPEEARERYPILRVDDLRRRDLAARRRQGQPDRPDRGAGARAPGSAAPGSSSAPACSTCSLEGGRVTGVRTDAGDIEAEVVVNCAGQWAKAVGAMAGVNVPLHSAEHFYVVTDPFEGVHPDLPVLRDPDGYTYFKEEVGGLVVGGFEPDAKPWVSPDEIPYPFEFQLLEEDWEHFSIADGERRAPGPGARGDRDPQVLQRSRELHPGQPVHPRRGARRCAGFFVGAGFNSVGIASAGGAGRALAEWIVDGEPTMDLTSVDVRRFARFNGNNQWLHDRVAEVLGLHYAVPWPNREMRTARPFRRSPLLRTCSRRERQLRQQDGLGARQLLRARRRGRRRSTTPGASRTGCPGPRPSTRTPARTWRSSTRPRSRSTVLIGPDAEDALQWLCTADVAVPVGRDRLHRAAQRPRHLRVRRDRHPARRGRVPHRQQRRDHRARPGPHPAPARRPCAPTLVDVTSQYAVLGVMGPRSRELLSRLTRADLVRRGVPVRHQPRDHPGLLDGARHPDHLRRRAGLGALRARRVRGRASTRTCCRPAPTSACANGGYYTIDPMRLEKGYRAFGRELTPDYGPVEAGLLFTASSRTTSRSWDARRSRSARREAGPRGGSSRSWSTTRADAVGRRAGAARRAPPGQVTSAAWGRDASAPASAWPTSAGADGPVSTDWLAGAATRSTSAAGASRPG